MDRINKTNELVFHPLTSDRWDDLVRLFGPSGCGGCWCMFWRMTRQEFSRYCGENNKKALAELINSGIVPGILGYRNGQPVSWCSIAPREDFASLERSRNLRRLDDRPVWSIVCFFIHKQARRMGLMVETIKGAVDYAGRNGAEVVEAYPVAPHGTQSAAALYMGNLSAFLKAGFEEIEQRGRHIIVRYQIQ